VCGLRGWRGEVCAGLERAFGALECTIDTMQTRSMRRPDEKTQCGGLRRGNDGDFGVLGRWVHGLSLTGSRIPFLFSASGIVVHEMRVRFVAERIRLSLSHYHTQPYLILT